MNLLLGFVGALVLTLLFGWLTGRAWRARRGWVKWTGSILAGLVTILGLAALVLAAVGSYRVYSPASQPAATLTIQVTPEQLARGERLANLCTRCHSTTLALPLDGGTEDFAPPLVTLVAPNLTPAGPLQGWTDGEIVRAIREGVDKDGRGLLIMPSEYFRHMSDEDVQALVAYLRSQPAVAHELPEFSLKFLGAMVIGTGIFPVNAQTPITAPIVAPPLGPTAEYGEYLVNTGGCATCHGPTLQGGGMNDFVPSGPNLPALMATWDAAGFTTFIRTGVDPFGRAVDPTLMPWPQYDRVYTDVELEAILEYIHSLPPG